MKKISALLMIFLLVFSLTGCGGNSLKSKKVKVTMWIMPNSQEPVNDLEAVLKPFKDKHPEIEIEIVSLDWGSAWQRITTAATSSDTPDICQLGSTWVGSIASMGAMQDLRQQVDAAGGKNIFVPAAWTTSGLINSDEVIAIPWIVDTRAMFYRTDVFKKLGLTANDLRNWDSFEKALAKIKKANLTINNKKVEPLGITGKNDWNVIHNISPWIWMAGGDFISKDLKTSVINSPQAVKGLAYYINLIKKGFVPLQCLEQNTSQISSAFNNGFYAVYFDGPFALKALTTPPERGGSSDLPVAKNFAVAPYPAGPLGRVTFCGGSNLSVFKSSRSKEAAWEVVKYLTTDIQAQVAYAKLTGFLPAKKEAFDDPYFKNDPYRKVFSDSVRFSRAYPCISAWGPIETVVLTRRFGLMWDKVAKNPLAYSNTEVQNELNQAVKEINVILQQ